MAEEEREELHDEEFHEAESGGLAAKSISKFFKFLAAGGVVVCAVLKWCGVMPEATVGEICVTWAAVYGIGAGTIDLNIMFDKFSGRDK